MMATRRRGSGWISRVGTLLLLGSLVSCDDPTNVDGGDPPEMASEVVLSNPAASGSLSTAGAAPASGSGDSSTIVYVSLPPGTVERGELADITNRHTGATARTAMADGGFDPVPIVASVGDTIRLEVMTTDGSRTYLSSYVPRDRRPIVVRTNPPRGKRDVVLNATIRIVFSEPMVRSTVTEGSLRLEGGEGSIPGQISLSGDGLQAEFRPLANLAPNATYTFSVTDAAADLTGDALEASEGLTFSTGTTSAVAMAYTNPAALFSVADGLRTFEFEAILHDDGAVTGWFYGFNPSSRRWGEGPVLCFGIVDGTSVWVSGVFEGGNVGTGIETGWIAADEGAPGDGVADRLSFAVGLNPNGLGTPQDFCDQTPYDPEIPGLGLRDLETGDIVITGLTPPPHPAPAAAHLEFAVPPGNGIEGRRISPAIEVRALDAGRTRTATGFSDNVTVALADNPGGATLGGTTTVVAANGVASFRDLTVSQPGVGYTLVVSGAGLTSDTSAAFDVIPPPQGLIAFHDDVGIHVMSADGSAIRTVARSDGLQYGLQQPAWSPDGIRLAFERSVDGHWQIYVVNEDGSGLTALTSGAFANESPSWSPDGQRIVFTSDRDGWPDVYSMNADGTDVRRVTADPAWDVNPVYSPDGARIAFASDRAAGVDLDIHVMNADGTGVTRLTESSGWEDYPDWSPDGSMIAYQSHRDGWVGGIHVMGSDGSDQTHITAGGRGPSWSPDGGTIVFASASGLSIVSREARAREASGLVRLGIEGYEPDWTPGPAVTGFVSPAGAGRR